MIKITLIVLGKLKEKYLISASDEYVKRLSRYCNLKIEEIPPEPLPENPSDKEIEAALSAEAAKIEKRLPDNAKIIALCVEGKGMSSEEFAESIKQAENSGSPFCFIIGSSHGLSNKIKSLADIKLSVSKMTFPHALFRVILLEQIYRAFKINEGGAYHK